MPIEPQNVVTVRVADALGFTAITDSYFLADTTLSVGDILNVVGVWLGRLQDCSGGRIVSAQVSLDVDVSAFAEKTIEPGTSTSSALVLNFPNDSDTLPWDFVVPAVSTTVLVDGGPDNTEGATIDLLADMMENLGPTLAGFTFASNRGGALVPEASGFLSTRKRGILESRKTLQVIGS
jgi:hypothetical protein